MIVPGWEGKGYARIDRTSVLPAGDAVCARLFFHSQSLDASSRNDPAKLILINIFRIACQIIKVDFNFFPKIPRLVWEPSSDTVRAFCDHDWNTDFMTAVYYPTIPTHLRHRC